MDSETFILAGTNVILAGAAVLQLRVANRSEARRVQPVVIAHQEPDRPFYPGGTRFPVYLTNQGTGVGFNVRYGVIIGGTEFPSGPGRGNRYRVAPGDRTSMVMIDVSYLADPSAPNAGEFNAGAAFYARYEDAIGKVWETRNPADLLANFQIQRRRLPRVREWRQARRRARVERRVLRARREREQQQQVPPPGSP